MSDLGIILSARARMLANGVVALRRESRLKVGFITLFVVAFWAGLFEGFREGFYWIGKAPGFENLVITLLFSMFFLTLLVMLVFSNAVLIYGSLYRSPETDFLMTLPVREESLFLYKFIETVFYSSWAFLYLGVPIVIAYGWHREVPWYFYPAAVLIFAVFVVIPASIGSLISMLLVSFVPKARFRALAAAGVVLLFAGVVFSFRYFGAGTGGALLGYSEVSRFLHRLSFSQNAFLPSHWLSRALLGLGHAQPRTAVFYMLVILSNALFLTTVAEAASRRLFWRSFSRSRSGQASRSHAGRDFLGAVISRAFFFLPPEIRLFLAKDVRVFLRDRMQWGQFLIFFGVLAVYIVNIRSLPYDFGREYARSGISLLNLAATCLVLSTFTGRFIYPLLSLEGRNFWVLGLAPVKRSRILYGKFFFAFFGALLVSETLILLSDWMLDFPPSMLFLHVVLVAAICSGLSAIAVGLGARYPNLKEENPARIVAGFGGTLNLIVSMLYIAAMIVTIGIPTHLAFARRASDPALYIRTVVAYLVMGALGGVLVSVFFLNVGRARFERMEF